MLQYGGAPPPPDISVTEATVRGLLREQHPDLADLPLVRGTDGWDNAMFRLGSDLAVRLPHRKQSAPLILHEQRWLPELAPALDVPIPTPVRVGAPGQGYPWHWSIVPWLEGKRALDAPPGSAGASTLGTCLRQLHGVPVPPDPPINPHRGGPLSPRREITAERLDRLTTAEATIDRSVLLDLFDQAIAAGPPERSTWIHGDVHGKNVLVDDQDIVGIIDWGDICTGDPVTDLASVWQLLDPADHERFQASYGPVSAATRARTIGWAISYGLMIWDSHHHSDPVFAAAALLALQRVSESS